MRVVGLEWRSSIGRASVVMYRSFLNVEIEGCCDVSRGFKV